MSLRIGGEHVAVSLTAVTPLRQQTLLRGTLHASLSQRTTTRPAGQLREALRESTLIWIRTPTDLGGIGSEICLTGE